MNIESILTPERTFANLESTSKKRVECSNTFAALFKLSRGIDDSAIDVIPVRIVLVVIAPQNEANTHLKMLAMLASKFGSPVFFEAVFGAENDIELYKTAILNLDEYQRPKFLS